jgi:hypothetical protein
MYKFYPKKGINRLALKRYVVVAGGGEVSPNLLHLVWCVCALDLIVGEEDLAHCRPDLCTRSDEPMKRSHEALNASSFNFLANVKCFIASLH